MRAPEWIDEWPMHLEALGWLWWARWQIGARGWRSSVDGARSLERSLESAAAQGWEHGDIEVVERALHRVSRLVPGVTCIHRALAGQRMLARRGVSARLAIGLRRGEEAIEGHAWLEIGGGAIDEPRCLFVEEGAGYREVESL